MSVTTTLTNWPGQSRRSVLGKVPLMRIVPVFSSTALSTNAILPTAAGPSSLGGVALTRSEPAGEVALELGQTRLRNRERTPRSA